MRLASIVGLLIVFTASGAAAEFSPPTVPDISQRPYPRITATASELGRLRAAHGGDDPAARAVVAQRVHEADAALEHAVEFPPRGGQHNQWYQCDDCQLALQTIDSTHHRCPGCKTVYSGEPYDDVVFSRTHHRNLRAMLAAAWAHALTGEPKYARFAADVLLGYAERYRDYPYHSANLSRTSRSGGHLFEQTLTEASAMAAYIAPAYDLVAAAGLLSEEEDEAIREGLLRPMLENIAKYRAGKSNWQTWHNAAILAAGGVLGERAWIERVISDPGNGFLDQMESSVSDEGMWYENSWGYHFYTLSAMIHIVEYARRLDVDLWSHPRLKSMFTIPLEYALPGGRLPRFGDDVNSSVGSATRSLEFAYHAYELPSMAAYLSQSPTWDSILLGRTVGELPAASPPSSRVFPSAGHAIARTGGPKDLVSVMTFGPYGGFHGHFDKLSFVFHGYGREFGVDPGRARSQAYRLPVHRNWYKATLAHNTVVVDRKSQSPAAGRLLQFDVQPARTAVVAQCSEAYDGVVHTRLLLQTADYLLVFDDLKADAEHRFDWFYHDRGETVECAAAEETVETAEADFPGMEYVENTRAGKTDTAISVRFTTGDVANLLTFDAAADTGVLIGDGVGASVLDRVPLVRVTRHGKIARFAVVLEPVSDGVEPTARSVSWREEGGQIEIEVTCEDHRDLITVGDAWDVRFGRYGKVAGTLRVP